jgi:hypothetical protein
MGPITLGTGGSGEDVTELLTDGPVAAWGSWAGAPAVADGAVADGAVADGAVAEGAATGAGGGDGGGTVPPAHPASEQHSTPASIPLGRERDIARKLIIEATSG